MLFVVVPAGEAKEEVQRNRRRSTCTNMVHAIHPLNTSIPSQTGKIIGNTLSQMNDMEAKHSFALDSEEKEAMKRFR